MIQTSKPHHLPVKSKGSVHICCCILRTENELNLKESRCQGRQFTLHQIQDNTAQHFHQRHSYSSI